MTMNWNNVKLCEGWNFTRDAGASTARAKFYAQDRSYLPSRGDKLSAIAGSINTPPSAYQNYTIDSVNIIDITPVGPFVAEIVAKPYIGTKSSSPTASLLTKYDYSLDVEENTIDLDYCFQGRRSVFLYACNKKHVGQKVIFPVCTASYYTEKVSGSGLGSWGTFYGIIPHSSFPQWLQELPSGDNRWRLKSEKIETTVDNDGETPIFHITRVLLGIPSSFVDTTGARMQWNQNTIGQRTWDEVSEEEP